VIGSSSAGRQRRRRQMPLPPFAPSAQLLLVLRRGLPLLLVAALILASAPPAGVAAAAASVGSRNWLPGRTGGSGSSGDHSGDSILKRWARSRFGGLGRGDTSNKKAIWVYRGGLYDPLNGQKIANVEGIEIVRQLAQLDYTATGTAGGGGKVQYGQDDEYVDHELELRRHRQRQRRRFRDRCGDLSVAQVLAGADDYDDVFDDEVRPAGSRGRNRRSATNRQGTDLDYAVTVLSRKLFCYTQIDEDGKRSRLLTSIRMRPTSPVRKIPVWQSAKVYDTATTYIEQRKRNNKRRFVVHTEYPDGRTIWTKASLLNGNDDNYSDGESRRRFEYVAYARPQQASSYWNQRLVELLSSSSNNSADEDDDGAPSSVSPRRSSLVQIGGFGVGGGKGNKPTAIEQSEISKYGARETYQYNLENGTVRYTRYGEGPVWYGPNRLCTLELTGRRLQSGDEYSFSDSSNNWYAMLASGQLPQTAAKLASDRILGFFSVNCPIAAENDYLARQQVASFRGKGHSQLRISPGSGGAGDDWIEEGGWFGNVQQHVAGWVHRIQSATKLTTTAGTSK